MLQSSGVVVAALLLFANLAGAAPYRAPRTASGAPDLQGIWTNASITRLQRPKDFTALVISPAEAAAYEKAFAARYDRDVAPTPPGDPAPAPVAAVGQDARQWFARPQGLARVGGQIRTSWIVDPADGRLPLNSATQAAAEHAASPTDARTLENPESRPNDERCLLGTLGSAGPPLLAVGDINPLQIVQTADQVVIVAEVNHDVRIVRLNDRGHLPAAIRPWLGDSVGWWEGEALVVETTNFNPGHGLNPFFAFSLFLSPTAKVTERFTRTSSTEVLYQFTVDDPAIYSRPWSAEVSLNSSSERMYEWACHEGNYGMSGVLAGARETERISAASSRGAEPR